MKPTLLFDGECAVCRSIAAWIDRQLKRAPGDATMIVRPIGDDPNALRNLNPQLSIWDAYATIHLVMPDGSMKTGGEAVAEVFRNLRATRWLSGIFAVSVFGYRPFQAALNVGYAILADVRPLLGCESCGSSNGLVRALKPFADLVKALLRGADHHSPRVERASDVWAP